MFSAHLVFGDIDHSSEYDFVERARIIETFNRVCEMNQPVLNDHSFFDVDNDSVMIGFSGLEGYLSGNDVLRFVDHLYRELLEYGINVSFGLNLIACVPEIDWSTCPGILNDIKKIYMPDLQFEFYTRVVRGKLTGDPLIIVARVLEIAKKTNNPICYALTNGGHFNDCFNDGKPIEPKIVNGWDDLIPIEHVSFLAKRDIRDIYYYDVCNT